MQKEVYKIKISPNKKTKYSIGKDGVTAISQKNNKNHVIHFKKIGIEIEIDYPKYIYRKVKK
ncbi:MAG: hypothetical protein ACQEQF_00530 [Bacillota bacterium]